MLQSQGVALKRPGLRTWARGAWARAGRPQKAFSPGIATGLKVSRRVLSPAQHLQAAGVSAGGYWSANAGRPFFCAMEPSVWPRKAPRACSGVPGRLVALRLSFLSLRLSRSSRVLGFSGPQDMDQEPPESDDRTGPGEKNGSFFSCRRRRSSGSCGSRPSRSRSARWSRR